MADCPGKDSWPELVGAKGEAAAAVIEKQNKHVNAIVLKDGTPVTRDFRCDRVWVWVNNHGIVIRTPRTGKTSWPELLGIPGKLAVAVISKENTKVNVMTVKEGMMVTADFRCDRVRVWLDKYGIVKLVPQIG